MHKKNSPIQTNLSSNESPNQTRRDQGSVWKMLVLRDRSDLLQPQVVEMLPHQPDHVLLARGQTLLLGDAIRDAVAVVAGRLLVVVDVDDSVAIVVDCQPVGVSRRGGGRLPVLGAVPTGLLCVGVLRRPVRLHLSAD